MNVTQAHGVALLATTNNPHSAILEVLSRCYEQGVRNIVVEFSGSGDEGSLDDIHITDADSAPIELSKLSVEHYELYDDLSTKIDYFIERNVDWNWVDDSGGGGRLSIDLETTDINVSGYTYEVETRDADGCSLDVEDLVGVGNLIEVKI
jgi:hypothetical protein